MTGDLKLFLSVDGRGYGDLPLQRLVAVGEGETPSQDLLGNKLPSQVFLSREGRKGDAACK